MIGSLFGIASGIAGGIAQSQAAKKQNAAQKELMDYQNKYNREQWERNNIYNSPENQRNLLRRAGMNPDIAYGNLASSAAAEPAPAADMQPVTPDYSQSVDSAVNAAQSFPTTMMAYKSTKADVQGKQIDNAFKVQHHLADLRKLAKETDNVELKNKLDKIALKYADKLGQQNYDLGELDKEGKKIENNIKAQQYMAENYRTYMTFVDAQNYKETVKLRLKSAANQILQQTKTLRMSELQYQMLSRQMQLLGPQLLSAQGQSKLRTWIADHIGEYATSILYGLTSFGQNAMNSLLLQK